MRGKPLQRPTFALGDFVFAKLRGYRPWPARVLARHDSDSNVKYIVFFYGTCNTAKLSPIHILDFAQNKQRLGVLRTKKSPRNADFREAMAHIRRAFKKPASDFVYYQVLARTEGEGGSSVAYETLTSTTETESDSNEAGSGDSTETPETHKPRATEQNSEEENHTKETESTSEKDEEPQPSKKPKISKPLLDKEDDDQDQALKAMEEELKLDKGDDDQGQTLKAMEKELKPKNVTSDIFSESDSDSFEFEGNPIVRSSPLKHFDERRNSLKMSIEKMIKLVSDSDSDDDSDNDQPVNLCCRHITGDEQ